MPDENARREVVFYRTRAGRVPLIEWFAGLPHEARAKCQVRLERLEECGHRLRRPEAAYLRDGISELRAKHLGMNYRMLYFFHGTSAVVVTHGLVKQRAAVPEEEIALAIRRRAEFRSDPTRFKFPPDPR